MYHTGFGSVHKLANRVAKKAKLNLGQQRRVQANRERRLQKDHTTVVDDTLFGPAHQPHVFITGNCNIYSSRHLLNVLTHTHTLHHKLMKMQQQKADSVFNNNEGKTGGNAVKEGMQVSSVQGNVACYNSTNFSLKVLKTA